MSTYVVQTALPKELEESRNFKEGYCVLEHSLMLPKRKNNTNSDTCVTVRVKKTYQFLIARTKDVQCSTRMHILISTRLSAFSAVLPSTLECFAHVLCVDTTPC